MATRLTAMVFHILTAIVYSETVDSSILQSFHVKHVDQLPQNTQTVLKHAFLMLVNLKKWSIFSQHWVRLSNAKNTTANMNQLWFTLSVDHGDPIGAAPGCRSVPGPGLRSVARSPGTIPGSPQGMVGKGSPCDWFGSWHGWWWEMITGSEWLVMVEMIMGQWWMAGDGWDDYWFVNDQW